MIDKNWFYFANWKSDLTYLVDVWTTKFLKIENYNYIVFHKRKFFKKKAQDLQKWMSLLTSTTDFVYKFDKQYYVYGLTYYQRNLKYAYIKWWNIDFIENYSKLLKKFWLKLKVGKYLEIIWNYDSLEKISYNIKNININQAISFVLALATLYWDWNIVEQDDIYISNVVITFPFDSVLSEYQNIIFNVEDVLIKNHFYNSLTYTKKWNFIWNIKDYDLLSIMWTFLVYDEVKDFFQIEQWIKPIFYKKKDSLKKQLVTDLRIEIDNFKFTEIESLQLDF